MKKVLIFIIIVIIGAGGVYFGLDYYNQRKDNKTDKQQKNVEKKEEDTEVIPSRDAFVSEAIKLQTLADNKDSNDTCKCYNAKDLDKNTTLSGSILVYTLDDLYVSTMWLSNGYYILDGYESAATGNLEESSEQASLYCGEESLSVRPSLCATNY
jgi:uncharacterized protein YxeA